MGHGMARFAVCWCLQAVLHGPHTVVPDCGPPTALRKAHVAAVNLSPPPRRFRPRVLRADGPGAGWRRRAAAGHAGGRQPLGAARVAAPGARSGSVAGGDTGGFGCVTGHKIRGVLCRSTWCSGSLAESDAGGGDAAWTPFRFFYSRHVRGSGKYGARGRPDRSTWRTRPAAWPRVTQLGLCGMHKCASVQHAVSKGAKGRSCRSSW